MSLILPVYKKILKNFNGKLALHGSFQNINPVDKNEQKRKMSIHRINQSVEIAKELIAKTIVMHSGFDTYKKIFYEDPDFIEFFIRKQVKFWTLYINKLEGSDIVIALENTSERSPDILPEIVNKINSPNLKLCVDTGHVNHKTSLSVCEWLKKTGPNLHHMHIHNNWKTLDDHNSLLRGNIDFKEVFKTLKDLEIKPNLSLEINDWGEVKESLDFMKKYL